MGNEYPMGLGSSVLIEANVGWEGGDGRVRVWVPGLGDRPCAGGRCSGELEETSFPLGSRRCLGVRNVPCSYVTSRIVLKHAPQNRAGVSWQ